jgi:hypothetical protein
MHMKRFSLFVLLALPFPAFAQFPLVQAFQGNPAYATPLGGVLAMILNLVSLASFIVGALALIWFFWGIIQYVLKGENIEKRAQSRDFMIYAVIGMFVMFSIWGLVNLVRNTFFRPGDPAVHLLPGDIPSVPRLP